MSQEAKTDDLTEWIELFRWEPFFGEVDESTRCRARRISISFDLMSIDMIAGQDPARAFAVIGYSPIRSGLVGEIYSIREELFDVLSLVCGGGGFRAYGHQDGTVGFIPVDDPSLVYKVFLLTGENCHRLHFLERHRQLECAGEIGRTLVFERALNCEDTTAA